MSLWTKLQVVTKVEADLDLEDEVFIVAAELTGYINEAIRDARAVICKLEEDYYLSYANLTVTLAEDEFALPTGIYLMKIRGITYNNGSDRYEVKRIRNYKKFTEEMDRRAEATADGYKYFIVNVSTTETPKIMLSPPSLEASTTNFKIWYLRDPEVVAIDADKVDVPAECINYVLAHVKRSCLAKMNGGTPPPEAEVAVRKQEELIISLLTDMTPDNDNEVEQDTSHYEDHT